MGGMCVGRDAALKVAYEEQENLYDELTPKITGIMSRGEDSFVIPTRVHKWVMQKKEQGIESQHSGAASVGGANLSWTSGNNCTVPKSAKGLSRSIDRSVRVNPDFLDPLRAEFSEFEISLLARGAIVGDEHVKKRLIHTDRGLELTQITNDSGRFDHGSGFQINDLEW